MEEKDVKKIKSHVTGKEYCPSETVKIVNLYQCAAYLASGAELLDIYTTIANGTNRPMIIMVFSREGTRQLYDLWCKHELL